ncbi:MAG: NAD(+) synthase [Prevotella sp.]|nr:NAD(+) synthase [Prevotella sp.]
MRYGFVKVAAAVPAVRVADTEFNAAQIISTIKAAADDGVEIVSFPELCITGYTCQDLFRSDVLLDGAEEALRKILAATEHLSTIAIVGMPVKLSSMLLNAAVVIQKGRILNIVNKTYLPNYNEYYEKRWFQTDCRETTIRLAGQEVVMTCENDSIIEVDGGVRFGVEICEDVWTPIPPSGKLALAGADIIFNLSASDDLIGKHQYLRSLLAQQSARCLCGYVYASCGFGESTQDVVYGGNALIYENGKLLAANERFKIVDEGCQMMTAQIDVERLRSERRANTSFSTMAAGVESHVLKADAAVSADMPFSLEMSVNPHPFIPSTDDMAASCEEILNIQTLGLCRRLHHIHGKCAVIGISGGLDSTLALLVTVRAFDRLGIDRKGIVGVTMPGFGTTGRTYNNALSLMQSLGITTREISITKSVTQHFADINHDINNHDVTYENGQARERTQILMDLSNQLNGIVVGTGDLSELALGWATYNGDHMSMYGVNAGVPKTLIRHLVNYVAMTEVDEQSKATLLDIIDTPISPELIPADEQGNIKQKTEDLVGPYELHDFFLYYMLRFGFSPKKIFMLAKRAFDGTHPSAGKYDDATIRKWLTTFCRRFFNQQFKRSCLPDGPKVGSVSLSPRGDWRMPSDAASALWLAECEAL